MDVNRNANETAEFLGSTDPPKALLPTNKVLHGIKAGCTVDCVYSLVKDWSEVIESKSKIANWQASVSQYSLKC